MTELFLIRHGETDWNVEGRWQGQADVPLNQRGIEQARILAQNFAKTGIQAIYSSDLSRAYATAEELGAVLKLPVKRDPRFREIHQGEWQGMLASEIRERYAELFQERRRKPMYVAPPGGETVIQVHDRAVEALNEIISKHNGQRIAIVAHGFILAVIRAHLENRKPEEIWDLIPENGGYVRFSIGNRSKMV